MLPMMPAWIGASGRRNGAEKHFQPHMRESNISSDSVFDVDRAETTRWKRASSSDFVMGN